MTTLTALVSAAKKLPYDELTVELKIASKRFNAAQRGARAGRTAAMDLEKARNQFYALRGVKFQLDTWGAC